MSNLAPLCPHCQPFWMRRGTTGEYMEDPILMTLIYRLNLVWHIRLPIFRLVNFSLKVLELCTDVFLQLQIYCIIWVFVSMMHIMMPLVLNQTLQRNCFTSWETYLFLFLSRLIPRLQFPIRLWHKLVKGRFNNAAVMKHLSVFWTWAPTFKQKQKKTVSKDWLLH